MVPGSASGVVSVPGGMNPETARIKTDLGKCVFSWFRIQKNAYSLGLGFRKMRILLVQDLEKCVFSQFKLNAFT